MDVIFDWNLGNMIYNGLITLRLCGFPFTEIRSFQVWCLPTLPVVKVTKNSECRRANSDDAGEQGGHSHWGVGFPQSYQLYSESVPEVLVFGRRL